MHRCIAYFILILSLVFSAGCLEKAQVLVVSSEDTSGSWFAGAKTATNKGGIPASIEIAWSRADRTVLGYNVYVLVEDPVTKVSGWELLDTVNSEQLKFIHSNLESGRIYTYKVKALALDGSEDGNTALKSTVAFEGISSVTINSTSTATAYLQSGTGAFDEVRIYAIPKNNLSSRVLVGTGIGNVDEIQLSGLQSGTVYRFVAAAFMKNINAEDGNTYYVEAQTQSESFGDGSSSNENFAYQGFMNVQSFGLAPNAPLNPSTTDDPDFSTKFPTMLENPRTRLVRLTWLPFKNATSSTKYKLVRASWSNTIDMTTTTACDVNIDTSCVVCTVTGNGPKRCEDDKVQAPPKAYKYAVSLVKKNVLTNEEWVENLPTTNANWYVTKVHIAPSYMVQVHRDSANYEMCLQMGRASNPRKWQRCAYQGFGDRPYATGPGKAPLSLDAGYYDQGYNFFIDRYRTACNWTKTAGACGSPNGCIGVSWNGTTNVAPSDSIGSNGDVYYGLTVSSGGTNGVNCYFKKSGVWRPINDTSNLTASDRAAMTTIDPGADGQKWSPVAYSFNLASSSATCTSKTTEYGTKRMLRRREWVTAAASPAIPGEPNYTNMVFDGHRVKLRVSALSEKRYECDRGTAQGATSYETAPSSIANMLADTNGRSTITSTDASGSIASRYFIGTKETIRCQSRWGTQGLIGGFNEGIFFSDVFIRTNSVGVAPYVLRGDVSDYDTGNRDAVGFEFGSGTGPSWGTSQGYSDARFFGESNAQGTSSSVWGPSYILPMGLPTGNGVFSKTQELFDVNTLIFNGVLGQDIYRDRIWMYQDINATRYYAREYRSRFGYMNYPDWAAVWNANLVCAQEAE